MTELTWIDMSEGPDCQYKVARVDLGEGVDAVFQHWFAPDRPFKPINARLEPNDHFWRHYDAEVKTRGWGNVEPWYVVFRERQIAALERFCLLIQRVLLEPVLDRDRQFMEQTRGNGVLHFG